MTKFSFSREAKAKQEQSINGYTFLCAEVLPTRAGYGMEVRGTLTSPDGKSRSFERVLVSRLNKYASATESRTEIVPKGQKVERSASNRGTTRTYRFASKLSIEQVRALAFERINTLKAEQKRIEREIALLYTLTSYKSFAQEREVLEALESAKKQAIEAEKQAYKERAAKWLVIMQGYKERYIARLQATFAAGKTVVAMSMLDAQLSRFNRVERLISALDKAAQ